MREGLGVAARGGAPGCALAVVRAVRAARPVRGSFLLSAEGRMSVTLRRAAAPRGVCLGDGAWVCLRHREASDCRPRLGSRTSLGASPQNLEIRFKEAAAAGRCRHAVSASLVLSFGELMLFAALLAREAKVAA